MTGPIPPPGPVLIRAPEEDEDSELVAEEEAPSEGENPEQSEQSEPMGMHQSFAFLSTAEDRVRIRDLVANGTLEHSLEWQERAPLPTVEATHVRSVEAAEEPGPDPA